MPDFADNLIFQKLFFESSYSVKTTFFASRVFFEKHEFEQRVLHRVRCWIEDFTTYPVLKQNFQNVSVFELMFSERVMFCNEINSENQILHWWCLLLYSELKTGRYLSSKTCTQSWVHNYDPQKKVDQNILKFEFRFIISNVKYRNMNSNQKISTNVPKSNKTYFDHESGWSLLMLNSNLV